MYFMREERKKKYTKEELEKYKGQGTDVWNPEMTAAADRHEKMYTNWNDDGSIKDLVNAVNIPEVDELSKAYLTNIDNPITDEQFEKKFNEIISKHPETKKALKKNLDHTASNILLKLRAEKEYRRMINGIWKALESHHNQPDDATYQSTVK